MNYQNCSDILYLCGCVLNQSVPDPDRVVSMNADMLYAEAQRHGIASLVFSGMEMTGLLSSLPEEKVKKWERARNSAQRNTLLFNYERKEICAWMESRGIWNMPLKGSVLQRLYSEIGQREMTDNDILYDASRKQDVYDYMTGERSYEVYSYSPVETYDDVFQKPPVYNFEMHRQLFDDFTPEFQVYYQNVRDRLLPDEGKQYCLHFSDEDFYIYMVAHAYKHFSNGGIGLRHLVDCYVWNRSKAAFMNFDYLYQELDKLGLRTFEMQCRTLSDKLLSGNDRLETEEIELLKYMCESGSFGTSENSMKHRLEKYMGDSTNASGAKRKYILERLFPGMDYYKKRAPFVYRHKILIPVYWIWRLCRRMVSGGMIQEFCSVCKTNLGKRDPGSSETMKRKEDG